jgi:hypothetical protein
MKPLRRVEVSLMIRHITTILWLTWTAVSAAAQPVPKNGGKPDAAAPYRTMGAPSDPKVDARWNRYHDYVEATQLLQSLARTHASRCRLVSLGRSHGGREMWLITIANFERGKELEKSAFWIDGGIHANEIQSVEVPLYTAWYLLEMYGRSETITRLVDERVFYVMPMMSPDSRDAHMYRPNTTHSPRTGQRPVDDDRDGLVDEDGADDLDGDGSITQMRIRDPNGRYKPHDDYPNYLVTVKQGEKGHYSLVGLEGLDNDGDGRINEDGDGTYDPNRNWAWNWQPEYVQRGAHQYPFSIAEVRMVADFLTTRPNIAGAQSYHNAGGMILRGPGVKAESWDAADVAVYQAIAKQGERMLPGYRSMNIAHELYEVYGGEVDWLHMTQGVFAFTNELFTPHNYFRQATEGHGYFGPAEQQQEFNKLLLLGDGVVTWREVTHPTYGKVEVGGLRKEWVRQPPSFLIEEELHRNMAFTLYHADQMPRVAVQSVETRPADGGLTEVKAVIANERLTPTRSAADVRNKISPPDRVSISGEDLKVLYAAISPQITFDRPTEQKRDPANVRVASIPGHGVIHVRWLVAGTGPFSVTVRSTKGGVATK